MNFNPKYVGLMTMMSVSFVLAGSGIGYAIGALSYRPEEVQKRPSSTTSIELTDKDKFLNNLLAPSSFKFSEFDASIEGLDEGKTLSLKSNDLSLNLFNPSSKGSNNRASGNITFSYGDTITESLGLYVAEDKVTVNYGNKLYYISTDSLLGILNTLTDKQFPIPTVNGMSFKLPSFEELASMGQEALNAMEESQSADGKTLIYTLPLPSIGDVKLMTDKETLTLTGVETPSFLTLPINGKEIKIKVKGSLRQDLESSLTDDVPENLKDVTDLNGLDGIFKTVLNMSKSKKVDATIKASLKGDDDSDPKVLDLRVSGNFDTGEDPFIAQVETLGSSGLLKGKTLITYSNGRTYVSANEKIKGYIDNTTIEGIMDVFKSESENEDIIDGLENAFDFDGSALDRLIKGDYSQYNKFLKSVSSSNDGRTITLEIVSRSLGLNSDAIFSLSLNLNEAKDSLASLSIADFPVLGNTLDASITLDNFSASKLIAIDKGQYGNYNGVLPIFKNLYTLFKSKKAGVSYELGVSDPSLEEPLNVHGYLSADLSRQKEDDLDSIPLYLSATTRIKGRTHTLEGRRVDNKSYLSYDNVFKQSVTSQEAKNIYKSIMDGINTSQGKESQASDLSEKTQKAFEILTNLVSKTQGLDLDTITEIFSVDNSYASDNSFAVSFDTSKLGLDYGNILLRMTHDDSFSINATGITLGSSTISLNLESIGYFDPLTSDMGHGRFNPEEYIEVKNFHNFTNGLFDLVNGEKKYGISLKASLSSSKEGAYTSHLIGKAFFDLENETYKGQLAYDMDKYDYDPSIDFSYNDPALKGTPNEGKLFAAYGHKLTKFDGLGNYVPVNEEGIPALYFQMQSSNLKKALETIENMSEDNLLYTYYSRLEGGIASIPFQQIIEKEDYLSLLDDFLRKVVLYDDKVYAEINPYYLGLSDNKNASSLTVTAYYTKEKITAFEVRNASIDEKTMNLDVKFLNFEMEQNGFTDFTKIQSSSFIDFNNFPLMVSLGLNTTENRYFTMKGSVRLDMSVIGISAGSAPTTIDTVSIHVDPGSNNGNKARVSGYVRLTAYKDTWTEYFIRPDREDTLIVRHFKDHMDMVLVTQEEILKHFPYYVMGWGMRFDAWADIGNLIGFAGVQTVGKVEETLAKEANAEEEIKGGIANTGIMPEKLVKGMRYDKDSKTFIMNADLGAINTGMPSVRLGAVDIAVGHKEVNGRDEINSFKMTGERFVDVSGAVKIGLVIDTLREYLPIGFEERYNGMMSQYLALSGGVENYYVIDKVQLKMGFLNAQAWLEVSSKAGKGYNTYTYGSDFPVGLVPGVAYGVQ